MKKNLFIFVALSLCALSLMPVVAQARVEKQTLIVIPARYTAVQFAFDVARLRPCDLVSYDRVLETKETVLYRWNSGTRAWDKLTAEDYASGAAFKVRPARVIIVGSDEMVPAEVSNTSALCSDVTRIPSLAILTMVNGFNDKLRFDNDEWKWLAGRHNLELSDANAERRKWGRYGPPGAQKQQPVTPTPAIEAAPAAQAEPAAAAPAAKVEAPAAPAPAATPAPPPAAKEEIKATPPAKAPEAAKPQDKAPEDK
jgi:hypothetical protein